MPFLPRHAWLVVLLTTPLAADPPPAPPAPPDSSPAVAAEPASPYGATYTPAELAALDRALHAGNMTRHDLGFRKDMAKGTYCLPLVKAMLKDPLLIASKTDELVAALRLQKESALNPPIPLAVSEPLLAMSVACALLADEAGRTSLARIVPTTTSRLGSCTWPDPAAPRRVEGADASLIARDVLGRIALPSRRTGHNDSPYSRYDFQAGRWVPPEGPGAALARHLPNEMLMREVFPSVYDDESEKGIQAFLGTKAPSHVLDAALALVGTPSDRTPGGTAACRDALCSVAHMLFWPREAFPTEQPMVENRWGGRVALGTHGNDVYEGDFIAIVDPGGDDTYRKGRFGAAHGGIGPEVGLLLDLGGNDTYDCAEVDCTLGAAILGVGILMDLGQGNDRYVAGHLSLGAAVGGMAMLYDDGGSDTYQGKTFTQGAAGYGIGILYDDAVQAAPTLKTDEETKDPVAIAAWDNDRLSAWCTSQGFSRTLGVGLCINTRGNEVYEAGGVYLHAPLFADRYQSFSQGFSIGAREHDIAGGVAALIDLDGNDRYLGDIYNQGVGYWYAAGLLYDGGGNDHYEMTQYGQGSGIHLAVGGLIDVAGSDAYVMHSGLGQGGSHDYAASVFHDRAGNDRYHGNTSCNGTGLTNSVGLHIDRAGDDTYASRRDGGFNAGRAARGFGSVGVLLDLGGKDDYLGSPAAGNPEDDSLWRTSDVGLGLDVAPPAPLPSSAGSTPSTDAPPSKVEIPAICRYEGPLTQEVFDQLWAISVRWEVGDNRTIVPEARKRLIAYGKEILPYLDQKVEKDESGLELRAYTDILGGLKAGGAGAEVLDLLRRNLAVTRVMVEMEWEEANRAKAGGSAVPEVASERSQAVAERRNKVALHLVGELKEKDLALEVSKLLTSASEPLDRRAAAVLGQLGSKAGSEVLLGWLAKPDDEAHVIVALGTLFANGEATFEHLLPLLDHPLVTVRTRLASLLAEKKDVYGPAVLGAFGAEPTAGAEPLSPQAVRTLLDSVVRGKIAPGPVEHVTRWAGHPDWGVRADVARVLSLWVKMSADPASGLTHPIPAAAQALSTLRTDADPYVRASAR